MNRKDLYRSFQEVDDDILERSETTVQGQRKTIWLRWSAAAACLCFAAAVTLPHFLHNNFEDDLVSPPTVMEELPGKPSEGLSEERDITLYGNTSDTYTNLPELLSYLSDHDVHENRMDGASQGSSISSAPGGFSQLEQIELVENTGVAVSISGEYSYHIGKSSVYISRLDGEGTKNIGCIETSANAVFICNNNLLLISEYCSGGDELNPETSVDISVYDITVPQNPALIDQYTQLGNLTACWMAGGNLYLITSDGVCACGWSRLEDPTEYYPSLSHNGEIIAWNDENISILGEPTRAQYAAVTVINGNSRDIVSKEALYGNILKLFYGTDWIAATVASETETTRENPVIYTFDRELNFTGKINTAQIMNAPETNKLKDYVPQSGTYLNIVSVVKCDGIYRMLGDYAVQNGTNTSRSFMAIAANTETGEAGSQLLSAENYPYGSLTEITWEDDCVIACIGIMNNVLNGDLQQKTRFLFAEFQDLDISFYENELTADHLSGRVGVWYGNPLDEFKTLIPMGGGIYVRYSHPAEGPGGFDLFDFSDSSEPLRLYSAESSLSGDDAFDYVWYVYDKNRFGTLKVLLGSEDYFRNVTLSWDVYTIDISNETMITLQKEIPLDQEVKTFWGADALGYTVFHVGDEVYYVMGEMTSAALLR